MSRIEGQDREVSGGYAKGEAARQRILESALAAFGEGGFKGATTRQIAEAAGVNLPALKYYFGGKEGLYLACADAIVERYRQHMLGPIEQAQGAPPAVALKLIVGALAAMAGEAEAWSGFVMREMAEPGPAFDILYEQVWAPGVSLVALLISQMQDGRAAAGSARIEALLLISSLSVFSIGRPVAQRYLSGRDDPARFQAILRAVEAQIDRLAQ